MKNVGYVLGEFPVLSETFVGNEIRAVQSEGLNVTPLTFRLNTEQGQPIDQALVKNTLTIPTVSTRAALKAWLANPLKSLSALAFILRQRSLSKLSLARSAGQLAVLLKCSSIDHVHAHFALHTAATAIVAAKLSGSSVSFVGHGYDVYAQPADLPLKLKFSNFAVAVCQDMKGLFENLAPSTAVHPIACGVDPVRYPFLPRRRNQTNGKLLFIGRLTEKKGLTELLYALANLPVNERPTVDLVGSGHLQKSLEALCNELHLENCVNFLGNQTSDWIIEHAPSYLALIAPFKEAQNGDRDTGPLVVKEAMAMGLPVITSAFMGCKEMLDEHSGFLCAPNDVTSLTLTIQRLLQQSEQDRFHMVTSARKRLETRFACSLSGRQLAAAIESI